MVAGATTYTKVFPSEQHSFDADAFDEAIRTQGIKFVHYRSMRCPVGLTDRDDMRRPHPDHSGCQNGFIYTRAGVITILFTGNSAAEKREDYGVLDGSSVSVSIPRHYDDTTEPCYLPTYDRMYLDDDSIIVPNWQLF